MPKAIPPEWIDELEQTSINCRKDAIELLTNLLSINPRHTATTQAVEMVVDNLIGAATANAYLRIVVPAMKNSMSKDSENN